MKITKLTIKNYRGVSAREEVIGEHGTIARGRNGAGKTSFIKALRAALAGNDIGADAIRKGADSAEILVDLGNLSVRRAITKSGSSLTVMREGFKAPKPQAFLTELLGTSPLDPLDLMLLKSKERRAKILEALPCSVTREQLEAWAPGLPSFFEVEGHGLEVVERARKLFYDRRAEANAKAKESAASAERAREALGGAVPTKMIFDVATYQAQLDAAKADAQRLAIRRDESAAQEERSAVTRERVIALREQAAAALPAERPGDAYPEVVEERRATLLAMRKKLRDAETDLELAESALAQWQWAEREASAKAQQATELEATLAAATMAPSEADLSAAADAVQRATTVLAQAKGAEMLTRQADEAKRLSDAAEADAIAAGKLDAVVKTLANEAPMKILSASEAIPGLTLDGDDVMLDGVRLDGLCGAEQMKLCVEIARRANGKSRFLIVDGLERLDPEQLDAFVTEATRGGFQLIGTKVDRGEVELVQIELADASDKAAE